MLTVRSSRLRLLEGNVGDYFAKHAQTLCLATLSYSAAVLQVSRFRAVVNLAVWVYPPSGTSTFLSALENRNLKRLSASIPCICDLSCGMLFGHRAFSNLTHLEILANNDDDDWSIICGLTALTHLTHFGYLFNRIDDTPPPSGMIQALRDILSTSISLKVIALFVHIQVYKVTEASKIVHGWLNTAQLDDPRLIVLGSPALQDDVYNDWEAFMHGRPDTWTCAQDMVQERRSHPV
jgi:hypothetical protein